ncbi:amidohydrolase [Poseidonocella sp. HB161398]|uniref:amidohydrolase family protein n=1 Tax=Poseidonocella sp. HB161398 TaxID=2320855 RepID=UPI001F10075B|nr:amidohydrolase family protein [Poseidonocella sp. HB161398]
MLIDAHQHFWQISRGDYGWMDDSVAPIRRDFLPGDLAPLAAAEGVAGSVLVQAAPSLDETRFLLGLAERTPMVLGVVGWIDLEGDAADQLGAIAHPLLKGIRPMLQDIPETGWILREKVLDGLEAVRRAGLSLDALVTPRHLEAIDRLAAALPGLPVVIDHCAKPLFSDGDPGAAWRAGMDRLAAHPQIACKLSGLAGEYGPGWGGAALAPVFGHVLAAFGAERLLWGSDWPVLELSGRYGDWLGTTRALAADLPASAQAEIFGGTARRVYRL